MHGQKKTSSYYHPIYAYEHKEAFFLHVFWPKVLTTLVSHMYGRFFRQPSPMTSADRFLGYITTLSPVQWSCAIECDENAIIYSGVCQVKLIHTYRNLISVQPSY